MKFSFLRILALFTLSITAIISCESDDSSSDSGIATARETQMAHLYDNYITVLQQQHVNQTDDLINSVNAFTLNPTSVTLLEARDSWKAAFLTWKNIETFNIGPIQNAFLIPRVHTWPVSSTGIESRIIDATVQNSDDVDTIGATIKGYAAIEYMLFNENDQIVIDQFTTGGTTTDRKAYLNALSQNLASRARESQDLWIDFETDFKTNLESGVNGNFNRVINAMVASLESIKGRKIEEVLNSTPTDITLFENYRSQISKEAIKANLDAVYFTYTGDFNDIEGFGIEEYTSEVLNREDIDVELQSAFTTAYSTLNNMNGSLENTAITDINQLEVLKEDVQNIIRLLKVDFSSAASIVITFNDNDGD